MVQSKLLLRRKKASQQLPSEDDVVFWSNTLLCHVIDDRGLSKSDLQLSLNHILSSNNNNNNNNNNNIKVVNNNNNNMLLLKCSSSQLKDDLLELETLVIMGVLLVFKKCDPRVDQKEWHVRTHVPLWVKIRGVPEKHFNAHVAVGLGQLLGGQVDDVDLKKRGVMRVKVRIDVDRPVLPGACLDVGEKEDGICWVSYEYENVCRLCNKCWRIGHLAQSCLVDNVEKSSTIHPNLPVFSVPYHEKLSKCYVRVN